MIDIREFYNQLHEIGISFFTGVPDSSLKDFCSYLLDNLPSAKHIINANEGCCIGLAAGHYLATANPALVYMQNSGLGNAINPLVSLVDKEVFSIPMIILIGWRGKPGTKDEPQHVKQGKVTTSMLETMGIPFDILDSTDNDAGPVVKKADRFLRDNCCPYAIVVCSGTFKEYESSEVSQNIYQCTREDAMAAIIYHLSPDDIIISSTGKISRELHEIRKKMNSSHLGELYVVGSMGHCAQVALGVSLNRGDRNIFCFDGDGSYIMHMGSCGIIGANAGNNFKHIVFNNGVHDSVGGQPTIGFKISIPDIAKYCGYKDAFTACNPSEIAEGIKALQNIDGPVLMEVRVKPGSRIDLGRPSITPDENKRQFMKHLMQTK